MKKLYILLLVAALLSCNKDEKLKTYNIVINDEIVETNTYDATISATYSYPSTVNIKLLYADNESLKDVNTIDPEINEGVYTFAITGLVPQTEYFYQLEYSNGMMTSRTDIKNFTTNPAPEPPTPEITVTTKNVSDITINSAKTGGTIACEDQIQIQGRGVCYSKAHNPTLQDHVISNGTGLGSFVSVLTDLEVNTEYYVKAYAETNDSIIYGNEVHFTTNAIIALEILTQQVTDITTTTATCGGNIISDGGCPIIVRGICWSTNQNPTISDEFTTNGDGVGEYTASITNLEPNTKYYVRAYAINSNDIYYGEQVSFTTEEIVDIQSFSVSETQKVLFSSGNLQYNSRSNTWKFADNQYDYCGVSNQYIGSNYSGWIDLFGYGTSGYNGCSPWLNSVENIDYANGVTNIAGTMYDWGMNNINGAEGEWRTLTNEEWLYLINLRNNASRLRAKAVVNGVKGFLLLPDNWVKPENITFVEDAINWSSNIYNLSQWDDLENSYAIFLPAAGNRNGSIVNDLNSVGGYWTSSSGLMTTALYFIFTESTYNTTASVRYFGRSVRLVKDF
ncbi:MAG: fibronectin type III domain-containing protein [Bacteroidales bacterium]|nr:fibronectin type III domain-containing protein [Bacteroidales bacterium]